MKKITRTLSLSRETIRTLDDSRLAISGAKPPLTRTACDGDGCAPPTGDRCATNTCGIVCGTTL